MKKSAPSKKFAPSKKLAAAEQSSLPHRLGALDAALLAIVLMLALFMMARSGFRRGMDLMPWPDGLEYAAAAVNLDLGIGPVLHFGGYSYPSRYSEGYPLILAVAYPILGGHVERLCLATMTIGLLAIAALYILSLTMFDRTSAFLSCAILAASPVFITYSTLVLSDVPTLAITILVALAFYYVSDAEDSPSSARWIFFAALCGLLGGFTVMIRPTNATILIGIAAAMIVVRSRRRIAELFGPAIAFAIGFAIFPAWQGWTNYRYLGGATRSGYVFWVPEVYGSFGKTFGARFLFGPTMPGNPHGNVISYLFILAGLDGMLGDAGDPRYLLYPFAVAVFAIVGIAMAMKSASRAALRVMWFGLAFLGALLILYLFYFFSDIAFILPATFIIFATAGFGIVTANRAMLTARSRPGKSSRDLSFIAGVVALDVMLAFSIAAESAGRITTSPPSSKMVPILLSMREQLPVDTIIVSNISLQFLELYLANPKTELIGLNPIDPGGRFTDYHLSRLYAKKSAGWEGPVPPVLFAGNHLNHSVAKTIGAEARAGKSLFLLMNAPERQEYADILKDELTQLNTSFEVQPIAHSDLVELYRLTAR